MSRGIWAKVVREKFDQFMLSVESLVGKDTIGYELIRDNVIDMIETAEGNAYAAGYYGNGSLDEDLADAKSDD